MSRPANDLPGIAVVGLAGRFPGAADVEQLWRNLRDGVETIRRLSDDDLAEAGVPAAVTGSPGYVRAASCLDGIECFDASFFDVNPREAEVLDPQQRLYLECAWQAFESAGYDCRTFPGRIGVYAGSRISDYFLYHLLANPEIVDTVGRLQILFGNDKDYLSTFTSYKLNLRGPSVAVQTACSSSLVAVHLACESLLNGECDMAIAGGVSVHLPSKAGYVYQPGGLLSPDGHCRSFDARAAGTVFGSGVGIVVLRRLDDALAAGDTVRAVILGSAVNNDGSLKVGFSAPSEEGQAGVIAEAIAVAGVEPDDIGYVEAHGSGTPIGDPIEIAALTRAFRQRTGRKGFCAIGSVKSNVGHLEAASGAAGLLKTVLALENGLLPPSLHFETPNPRIDFADSPFFVNATPRVWETGGRPRLAGVSSFGLGGTNAHVVLAEAPEPVPSGPSRPWQLLVLSGRTETALNTVALRLREHLERYPEQPLADVAFTCQVGRHAFEHRRAVLCQSTAEACRALAGGEPGRVFDSVEETRDRPVAFLFPGLGDHYSGMGRELYRTEPVFREELDRCARLLEPQLGVDLIGLLYPAGDPEPPQDGGIDLRRMLGRGGAGGAGDPLRRTLFAHPAVFALEHSLARLWMAWGVKPQALIGYSLGEYTAACLAGVLSLEDALALVTARARLIEELPEGGMLAVPLAETELRSLLPAGLWLAAVNGTMDCVASGSLEGIRELERRLEAAGVVSRRLETSRAFHSGMMEPIVGALQEHLRQVRLLPPRIPFVSNVTGTWIRESEATDPGYWARHLCQTVRFEQGVGELLAHPDRLLLEVGPGQTLSGFVRLHPRKTAGQVVLACVRHRDHQQSDAAVLLTALGRLWLAGVRVDWAAFSRDESRRRVVLPTYPFERKRYWLDITGAARQAAPRAAAEPRKRSDLADWFHVPVWKQSPPPAAAGGTGLLGARVLVLPGEAGWSERVVARLREAGAEVTRISAGEDLDALLARLEGEDRLPEAILHLEGVGRDVEGGRGLAGVLGLAQALGRRTLARSVRLVVAASALAEVTGDELLCPEASLLCGACRVIPQEYPDLSCRLVDVVLPVPGSGREGELIDHLLAEAAGGESFAFVALRNGLRWVQGFEAVRLGPAEAPPLRQGGVYVITGGLGGLGLALAERLARTVAARLVLIGRSALPAGSARAAKLAEIEALGAGVMVASADVASREQMRGVLAEARRRFGAIHGVFHAAGVPGGGVIQLATPDRVQAVLRPKVEGARALAELAEELFPELEILVCFSSMLAHLGGAGQCAYAAANSFLDAFARAWRARTGRRAVAIDWDRWIETGMVAAEAAPPEDGILTAEGLECLERILARPALSQVVVSVRPFRAVLASAEAGQRGIAETALETVRGGHPRPALQTPYLSPQTDLQACLAGLWGKLLGIDQIGIHDNFFELGGDSLRGIQLVTLGRKEGLDLTSAEIFAHPTVAQLAAAIRPKTARETPPAASPTRAQVRISDDELAELIGAFGEVEVEVEE